MISYAHDQLAIAELKYPPAKALKHTAQLVINHNTNLHQRKHEPAARPRAACGHIAPAEAIVFFPVSEKET